MAAIRKYANEALFSVGRDFPAFWLFGIDLPGNGTLRVCGIRICRECSLETTVCHGLLTPISTVRNGGR